METQIVGSQPPAVAQPATSTPTANIVPEAVPAVWLKYAEQYRSLDSIPDAHRQKVRHYMECGDTPKDTCTEDWHKKYADQILAYKTAVTTAIQQTVTVQKAKVNPQ